MAADEVQTFESDKRRDAQIRENTRKLRRHEKLGLVIGGYLIAEGSDLIQDLVGIFI